MMLSTKEKIDQALGISCGKSMDQMLDELNIESSSITDTLDKFDSSLRESVKKIDEKAAELQKGVGGGVLAITDMTDSLKEIENLVNEAKQIFLHIKENIVSSDLIDSELIQGAAKFLEAVHVNIAEFISIYKQKSKFIEKIKLMIFQQEQKKELMEIKHRQALELLDKKASNGGPVIEGAAGGYEFDTDRIIKDMAKSGAFEIGFEDDEDEDDNDEEDTDNPKKKKTAKTAE